MTALFRRLEDFVWPRGVHCLCCGCVSGGMLLCEDCREELDAIRLPDEDGLVRSVWQHADRARELVIGLKHGSMADCAAVLAPAMAETLRQMSPPQGTVLTWVTMPEDRRRERGIDHGRLLCEAVAAQTGLPCDQLLIRRGKIHTQQGLNRAERLQNLSSTLLCPEEVRTPVLLIDDVLTTGATTEACSRALRVQGARWIGVLTATRVIRPEGTI